MNGDSVDDFYKTLGRNIRSCREGTLSQEALADQVEMARTSITNIESGRQRPSIHIVWEIANILGVSVSSLLPSPVSEDLDIPLSGHDESTRRWVKSTVASHKKQKIVK